MSPSFDRTEELSSGKSAPPSEKNALGSDDKNNEVVTGFASDFNAALEAGDITRAEDWLRFLEENKEFYPRFREMGEEKWNRMINHRSRELLDVLFKKEEWARAKLIVKETSNRDEKIKLARQKRLVSVYQTATGADKKFEDIGGNINDRV